MVYLTDTKLSLEECKNGLGPDSFLKEVFPQSPLAFFDTVVHKEKKVYLKDLAEVANKYTEIIGNCPEMIKIFRSVALVAPSATTVLILGETGTGKELIARAIHNDSPRKSKPMVIVNCACLPVSLIESELFGHERGSFTGATERRTGLFEQADGGTVFLDEIGELPLEMQVKLLRVLQQKEINRIGGKGTIKVNVRIIASTNRDLEKEVRAGRFRMDLYYRLNIFPIYLPALRDRREDIPALIRHFIICFSKEAGKKIDNLDSRVLQELLQYNWPGNIRELEHLMERAVLLTTGNTIVHIDIPSRQNQIADFTGHQFRVKTFSENERDHILETLRICRGRIAGEGGAADLLDVPPTTLQSKIKRLGIRKAYLP